MYGFSLSAIIVLLSFCLGTFGRAGEYDTIAIKVEPVEKPSVPDIPEKMNRLYNNQKNQYQ